MPANAPKYVFSPSGIAAISTSMINTAFCMDERRAAARAILRYRQHMEDHFSTREDGGLYPTYIDLHGHGDRQAEELDEIKMVVKESMDDVFDAVSPSLDSKATD
jgi:hypothetical protein